MSQRGDWMGGRYWITGVQLGLLKADIPWSSKMEIIDKVIDEQFIGKRKDLEEMMRHARTQMERRRKKPNERV